MQDASSGWAWREKVHTVNYYVMHYIFAEKPRSLGCRLGNDSHARGKNVAINSKATTDAKTFMFLHKNCFKSTTKRVFNFISPPERARIFFNKNIQNIHLSVDWIQDEKKLHFRSLKPCSTCSLPRHIERQCSPCKSS
jgi:hypothetical protein